MAGRVLKTAKKIAFDDTCCTKFVKQKQKTRLCRWSILSLHQWPIIGPLFLVYSAATWADYSQNFISNPITQIQIKTTMIHTANKRTDPCQWCGVFLAGTVWDQTLEWSPWPPEWPQLACQGVLIDPVDGWLHYCTTACCVTSSCTQHWHTPLPIRGCSCIVCTGGNEYV